MRDIDWLEPTSVSDTAQMLSHYQDEGTLVAGGTWVTLVLKQKLLMPSALISLRRVPGLGEITYLPGEGLSVGALVTHREMERSPVIREYYPFLAETFALVANVRIRYQATVGGVLCDADYASDPPATLAALNASVKAVSAEEERMIPVREFIIGHYTTALRPDELVTEVFIPEVPERTFGAYLKYRTRSHEDRPCLGVAVILKLHPDGRCQDLQVVIGAVSDRPCWVDPALEKARDEKITPELVSYIASQYSEGIEPLSDIRASSWYRKEMIRVFTRRGIETALASAKRRGLLQ
jgi:carbon-monoxide dehydrogenase medium subunit